MVPIVLNPWQMRVILLVFVVACATERELPEPQPAGGVHPPGMLDQSSPDWHGTEIARRGYDLNLCSSCHGTTFAGGEAGVSCRGCHPAGPDACVTCHRDGPSTGAHLAHRNQACAECHVVPASWDAEGHVRRNGALDPPPAEVTFGAFAATATPDRKGPPTFDSGTCTNVYCHGAALHAGGGTTTTPTWASAPTGGCTQCHAAPPPSHARNDCATCHQNAAHLDGALEVASACNSCHRSSPVFADLAGSTTSFAAGAHQAHLAPKLRGPLACAECHLVPNAVTDPGHIDSIAPAEVTFGTLAHADNAAPVWDRLTGTCTGTYCHGNGIYLSADPIAGTLRTPDWTAGSSQAYCGACHGVPPTTHPQNLTLGDCARCHPSVDSQGNPIVDGTTSRHMDGVVDVL